MTTAYTVDKPHPWRRWVKDTLVISGLSVALIFGTHYGIKYEKEIKEYTSKKVEQIEKQAKKYLDDLF